jgi:hypothetical protein
MQGITTLKFKVSRTFILKEYSKNKKKSKQIVKKQISSKIVYLV